MRARLSAMSAAGLLAAGCLAGVGLAGAQADSHRLPMITGGGHTENNNSGGGDQTSFGGFVAQATEPGEQNGDDETTYTARGELQGRSATTADHQTVGRVHGDVVCIANLGPSSENDGGGNPDGDVWEIRFRVERSDPALPAGGPFYGSIFVQDNGPHEDYADESFQNAQILNPECGNIEEFQLEPHQGQITVHD